MAWLKRTSSLASAMVKRESNPLSLSLLRPTHFIGRSLQSQHQDAKPSVFQEIIKQSTTQQKAGSKVTIGAAMLLGVSIMVSPFKEGSPAKIILNTTDILLKERKRKRMPIMSLAWWKASYAWVLVHLWAMVVVMATWWKISRS